MELRELTKRLCGIAGPSGYECAVYDWIADYIKPFADEVKTDAMGNLMAIRRCGKPGAKTLLFDAHMDEIGFIVTSVEDGFLKFAALGGVDPRMLPAREVRVLTDPPMFGVIDTMPPHILSEEDMEKTVDIDRLCIDVGLSQEAAEKTVPLGTPVVYAGGCEELGSEQLCGKALDDRSCAAILLKVIERLKEADLNVDVCCLISTQEEVGLRGAAVGAWNAAPDFAVAVDVTHARTPDAKDVPTEAGKGAAIGVGPNMNRGLTKTLFRLAQERGISHQTEVCPGGDSGTNAAAIQISRCGVATALVSLPLKYMHTPLETARCDDMTAICDLLVACAESMEV